MDWKPEKHSDIDTLPWTAVRGSSKDCEDMYYKLSRGQMKSLWQVIPRGSGGEGPLSDALDAQRTSMTDILSRLKAAFLEPTETYERE